MAESNDFRVLDARRKGKKTGSCSYKEKEMQHFSSLGLHCGFIAHWEEKLAALVSIARFGGGKSIKVLEEKREVPL